jgi:glycosyltransferase involved in cell wall biosynthesis
MKISVILCTYNRCQSLVKALESAAALRLPSTVEWELLVIDNNSRDQTRDVAGDFVGRYPGRFRYLFEPQQGKSHALNAGIRAAQGDLLAFMDDDVFVDTVWLQNLTASMDADEWQGAGGRILPDQSFSPPRWLAIEDRYACAPLAMFDLGNDACDLTEPPFGTNMAFRKAMFEKYGGFRTDLGPRPGSEIRNEDTEFGQRLLTAGERLRYEPSAIVYHAVPECRIQKKYFLAWWFDKARADIRAFGIPHDVRWCVAGVPLVMFRRLAVWTLRWIVAVVPSCRFSCKRNAWSNAGAILECYRQSRDAKTKSERQAGME